MAQVETYQLSTDGSEPVERLSVANRGYHQLSFSEIGGGKRISRHLSGFSEEFRIVDNPGVNPVRSGVLRQSQGNFSVALEPLISTRLARRPFAFWDAKSSEASKNPGRRRFKNFYCPCPVLTFFGSELHDTTQHGPDHKSRNCDGADRHEIDGSEPNHLPRAWSHHSQPFSGVLPRNTL